MTEMHKFIVWTWSRRKPPLGSNARATLNLRGNAGRMDAEQRMTVSNPSAKAGAKKRYFQVRDLDPAAALSHISSVQHVYVQTQQLPGGCR